MSTPLTPELVRESASAADDILRDCCDLLAAVQKYTRSLSASHGSSMRRDEAAQIAKDLNRIVPRFPELRTLIAACFEILEEKIAADVPVH